MHFSEWPHQELVQLDSEGLVMHDAFINSVKEADFLRNGNAKGIMSLSKEDSSGLWDTIRDGMYPRCLVALTSCAGLRIDPEHSN